MHKIKLKFVKELTHLESIEKPLTEQQQMSNHSLEIVARPGKSVKLTTANCDSLTGEDTDYLLGN